MKKRIFALVLAAFMLVSVFAFTGCKEKKTPKELVTGLVRSNLDLSAEKAINTVGLWDNTGASGNIKIEKLSVMGSDLLEDSITLSLDGKGNSGGVTGDLKLLVGDEELKLSAVLQKAAEEGFKAFFNVDGLTGKFVSVDSESIGSLLGGAIPNAGASVGGVLEAAPEMEKLADKITESFVNEISALDESKFVREEKDVTVGELTVKKADSVKLDLSAEEVNTIIKNVLNTLLESEEYNSIMDKAFDAAGTDNSGAETDAESLKKTVKEEIDKALEGVNVDGKFEFWFVDNEAVGTSIELNVNVSEKAVALKCAVLKSGEDSSANISAEVDKESLLTAQFQKVGDSFKANGKIKDVEFSAEKTEKAFTAKVKDFEIAMTSEDGIEYKGTVKIVVNENPVTVDCGFRYTENEFGVSVEKITTTSSGIDVSIPVSLTASSKKTETEITGSFAVELNAQGLAELKASGSLELKKAEAFTVQAPADAQTLEEFTASLSDFSAITDFISAHPKLMNVIQSLSGIAGKSNGNNDDFEWTDDDFEWTDDENEQPDNTLMYVNDSGSFVLNLGEGYAMMAVPVSASFTDDSLDIEVFGIDYHYDITLRDDEYDPTVGTYDDGYTWQSLGLYDIGSIICERINETSPDGETSTTFGNYAHDGVFTVSIFDGSSAEDNMSGVFVFSKVEDNVYYFDNGEGGITGSITVNEAEDGSAEITVEIDQLGMTFTGTGYTKF